MTSFDVSASSRTTRTRRRRKRAFAFIGAALVVATVFFVWAQYRAMMDGLSRSSFTLDGADDRPVADGEANVLFIGLDSRVDQGGHPFAPEIYDALHAGDEDDGGYNANVLMLMHFPAEGPATGISIPRDDFVDFPDEPYGVSQGKIKEAYGLAFAASLEERTDGLSDEEAYGHARAVARQTQIRTVSDFLGGVRIDHFVEVDMAGFYEVAAALQPVTVCLNHETEDTYSGAAFAAGEQEISAAEAMSFVRQRRDTGDSDLVLTDLDRTRRQQAFLVSLVLEARKTGLLLDLPRVQALAGAIGAHLAVDSDFDPLSFAGRAGRLAAGELNFVTLPVRGYEEVGGQDVNIVDLQEIRAIVSGILAPVPSGNAPADASPETSAGEDAAETTDDADVQDAAASGTSGWQRSLVSGTVPCVD